MNIEIIIIAVLALFSAASFASIVRLNGEMEALQNMKAKLEHHNEFLTAFLIKLADASDDRPADDHPINMKGFVSKAVN
jgi:hypothetical protein